MLNKRDRNKYAKLDEEKPMEPQPFTKNYGQLSKARNWRDDPPLGRANKLVVQNHKVCSENVYISYIIQTLQVIFKNIYVNTYMHAITINGKRSHQFGGK